MRFIDIHNHLLPGVDDGSRNMAESLSQLELFAATGVTELVMTPHVARCFPGGSRGLEARMRQLQQVFEKLVEVTGQRADLPSLHLGQELFAPDEHHLQDLLESPALGLGATGFLLVEFGFSKLTRPEATIELARRRGWEIIVAHPERYRFESPEAGAARCRSWIELGAFLQISIGSLEGLYERWSPGSRRLAWLLLEEGAAHMIGSDHHHSERSRLLHRRIASQLEERGGRRQAETLLSTNPGRILAGRRPVEVPGLPPHQHQLDLAG